MKNKTAANIRILCSIWMLTVAFAAPVYAQDITTGLIGRWALDEESGSSINDSSLNTNTGTWSDSAGDNVTEESVDGQFKTSIDFDGTDDFISIPDDNSLDAATAVTVSAWVNPETCSRPGAAGTVRMIASKWQNSTDQRSWALGMSRNADDCNVMFTITDDGVWNNDATNGVISTDRLPLNTWSHVIGTYDGATRDIKIYVNGMLWASNTLSDPGTNAVFNSTVPIHIGSALEWANTNNNFFNGSIDDVRIYDRALTVTDVKELYQSIPGALRYKETTEGLEYFNSTEWVHAGLGSYKPNGVTFDGATTNLYLASALNGVSDGSKVTGSAWIKRDSAQSGNLHVLLQGTNSNVLLQWEAGDRFFTKYKNAEGDDVLAIRSSATYTDSDWHHVMWSADMNVPGSARMYVDGVDVTNNTIFGDVNAGNGTNNVLDFDLTDYRIGANIGATAAFFNGEVADLWIDFNSYIDLSDAANRQKFLSANGVPMYLGPDGSRPLGKRPDIFLSGATDDWHTNKGAGGGFTENGTLTDAVTEIVYPEEAELNNFGLTLSDTGKYGDIVNGGNGKLYGIPRNATDILVIDTEAGTATRTAMGADLSGSTKWMDGVLAPNGKIYGIPRDATDILVIDTTTGTATRETMGLTLTAGGSKWEAGVLGADGNIYGIPRDATEVLIIDPTNDTASLNDFGLTIPATAAKYLDAVAGNNGKIYALPYDETNFLVINTNNGTATQTTLGLGTLAPAGKWASGTLGKDGNIYGVPWDASNVVTINTETDIASESNFGVSFSGSAQYAGATTANDGNIYGIPFNENEVLIIDPYKQVARKTNFGLSLSGATKFEGSALSFDNKIYAAPRNIDSVLIINPRGECSNPAELGGSVLYNTDFNVMQYCNGVDWVAMGPSGVTTGGGCINPTGVTGDLIYNQDYDHMQYCNSRDWIGLGLNTNETAAGLASLVAHWKLDETSGQTVADSIGNNDGTSSDATPNWQPSGGVRNGALLVDSSEAIDTGTWNVTGSGITLSGWVNMQSIPTQDPRIICKTSGITDNQHDWCIFIDDANDEIEFRLRTENGFETNQTSGLAYFANYQNEWHQITVTYDNASAAIAYYIDGVQVDTDTHSAGGAVISSSNVVALGNNPSAIGSRQWGGLLDELRVYNSALTPAQVFNIYQQTSPFNLNDDLVAHWKLEETSGATIVDALGNNNGTWNDNTDDTITTESVAGIDGNALDFEIDDQAYINIDAGAGTTDLDNLGPMTVCAWVNFESMPGAGGPIIDKRGGASFGNGGWQLGYNRAGGERFFFESNLQDGFQTDFNTVLLGQNQHVCASWDGNDGSGGVNIYIDAVRDNFAGFTDTGTIDDASYDIEICRDNSSSTLCDSVIDDVRIYDRVLNNGEIKLIYEATR